VGRHPSCISSFQDKTAPATWAPNCAWLAGDMTLGNPAKLITPEVRLLAWQQSGSQAEFDIWIERLVQCSLNDDHATAPQIPRPGHVGALLLRTRVLIRKLQKGWRHGLRPPVLSTEIGA
jgi:hypothetical protein